MKHYVWLYYWTCCEELVRCAIRGLVGPEPAAGIRDTLRLMIPLILHLLATGANLLSFRLFSLLLDGCRIRSPPLLVVTGSCVADASPPRRMAFNLVPGLRSSTKDLNDLLLRARWLLYGFYFI